MSINTIRFLLQLKNASLAQNEFISIKHNRRYINLLKILYQEGFIQSFRIETDLKTKSKTIIIILRYYSNKPVFSSLKLISTPSLINYISLKNLYKLNDKKFVFFLYTGKGLLKSIECKQHKIGGKLIFVC